MDEELREWRETAPYWGKHASTIRAMFAPVTAALIEEAGVTKGRKVLDVAGGAGEPSLTIAQVVAPSGSVTFTDAIANMVSTAKAAARQKDLTNIEFQQCPADCLPFPDNSFDVVVSRLGAMFFPDPLAALREILRVTKPGGAVSLVVWSHSEANPFSFCVTEVVSRLIPAGDAPPTACDAFRFAERGKLAGILREAGATQVRERLLDFDIAAPISPEQFWDLRSETSGTLREKLKSAPEEKQDRIKAEVLHNAARYFPDNQMKFPAQMLIITGQKPG